MEEVLTPDALSFLSQLVRWFSPRRQTLLEKREETNSKIRQGVLPAFIPGTQVIRDEDWTVGPIPKDLEYRRVEITGPVERKMMINALNSGADVYMADFEDSFAPDWAETLQGQVNLKDAVDRRLEYTSPEGKRYRLNEKLATLCVRPRGLHLVERHVLVDGKPVPAALFDFALFLYHNAKSLQQNESGPYYYLAKLENHLEARFWNDVFEKSEEVLGLSPGTIKATVLVETITAAFEMDEILFELRRHATALNLGRWDYIFSFIKRLGHSPNFITPDRKLLTMDAPFLKAVALLLVQTCHKRGAYAIGGMAAQVPVRSDPKAYAEAVEKVTLDKLREVGQGYDGSWVAHPDLVPVVMRIFQEQFQGPNQLHVKHEGVRATRSDLLVIPEGEITEDGLQKNIEVCLRYLESWLRGTGCVAINNLMEDAATVEICRAQMWQWLHHQVHLSNGKRMTQEFFQAQLRSVLERITEGDWDLAGSGRKYGLAVSALNRVVTSSELIEFTPQLAYDYLG